MMRHMSGLTVLLVLAVVIVAGTIYVRLRPAKEDDPVADAVAQMDKAFGFEVSGAPVDAKGGLVVQRVRPGSAAEQLGIHVGDRFVAVGDRSIWHAQNMLSEISEAIEGGPVPLLVEKDGAYRQVVIGGRGGPGGAGGPMGAGRGRRGGGPMGAPTGTLRGPGISRGDGAPARGR
jgi:membrane-associated protease RseP (regulator of RpoE activity)